MTLSYFSSVHLRFICSSALVEQICVFPPLLFVLFLSSLCCCVSCPCVLRNPTCVPQSLILVWTSFGFVFLFIFFWVCLSLFGFVLLPLFDIFGTTSFVFLPACFVVLHQVPFANFCACLFLKIRSYGDAPEGV